MPHELARVKEGPYRGIWADREKVEWIDSIWKDVNKFAPGHERILFHPHFPAGYLFSNLKPANNNLWHTVPRKPADGDLFLQNFQKYESEKPLVVIVRRLLYHPDIVDQPSFPLVHDKLQPYIEQHYRQVAKGDFYEVYTPR